MAFFGLQIGSFSIKLEVGTRQVCQLAKPSVGCWLVDKPFMGRWPN